MRDRGNGSAAFRWEDFQLNVDANQCRASYVVRPLASPCGRSILAMVKLESFWRPLKDDQRAALQIYASGRSFQARLAKRRAHRFAGC